MDFDRNSMTVPVQSSDYTKKFLQKDSNPTTMEVVTQTNAVRSPTDSPATTKLGLSMNHLLSEFFKGITNRYTPHILSCFKVGEMQGMRFQITTLTRQNYGAGGENFAHPTA